jgi:hypothetical protein
VAAMINTDSEHTRHVSATLLTSPCPGRGVVRRASPRGYTRPTIRPSTVAGQWERGTTAQDATRCRRLTYRRTLVYSLKDNMTSGARYHLVATSRRVSLPAAIAVI